MTQHIRIAIFAFLALVGQNAFSQYVNSAGTQANSGGPLSAAGITMGCSVNVTTSASTATCNAGSFSCTTTNAALVQIAQNINPASGLIITSNAPKGTCTSIQLYSGSSNFVAAQDPVPPAPQITVKVNGLVVGPGYVLNVNASSTISWSVTAASGAGTISCSQVIPTEGTSVFFGNIGLSGTAVVIPRVPGGNYEIACTAADGVSSYFPLFVN